MWVDNKVVPFFLIVRFLIKRNVKTLVEVISKKIIEINDIPLKLTYKPIRNGKSHCYNFAVTV